MLKNRVVSAAVAACLMLAACGGTSEEAETEDASAPASPLAEFMGDTVMFDSEDGEEQFAEQQRQINESVVACMAAEGWEYTPENVEDTVFFDGGDADGLEWGSREWTEKYGFGITTQMFPQETVGPELVGYADEGFGGPGEEYEDPNGEYIQSLSESDSEAYYEDLYGSDPGPNITEEMTDEEMDAAFQEWEENRVIDGCYPQAEEEFYGPDDFYTEFGDEMDDMWDQMMNDPRIVAAETSTAECVSDKGLTYSSMEDVYEDFYERVEPMQEQVWNSDMPDLTEEEFEAMSDAELDAIFNQPPELTPEIKAELAELQAEEIELAIAVDDCGGGQRDQEDLFNEVRIEYEQNFVDSNRDRLEQYQAESAG